MNKAQKMELVKSVLDELAIIGYLDSLRCKREAVALVKTYLQPFEMPKYPTKADVYINQVKSLVNSTDKDFSACLYLASQSLENALTELQK